MPVVEDFPHSVREIDHDWITLSDDCRLAARIWLPEDAESEPVPAILEYLPYRKRDGTAQRDALTHPWFAGHGYACVRVDLRGNGESDGLMWDEYSLQEQDDALEVIAWIAAQPWCSGRVGMMGISWGGFNGLQVAARRPPALGAVITLCSTVDRFADDIHYKGGCLLAENLGWSSTMLSYSTRPPDPALVGERWRELWLRRLEHQPHLAEIWLTHQRRDDYSTAYWPLIWPDPLPVTLTLYSGTSRLELPVRRNADHPTPVFAEPENAPPLPIRASRPNRHERRFSRDYSNGTNTAEFIDDFGEYEDLTHGLIRGSVARERYTIDPIDPTSARMDTHWTQTLRREGWSVRTEAYATLHCDAERFHLSARVEAWEGETRIHEKHWERTLIRDHL